MNQNGLNAAAIVLKGPPQRPPESSRCVNFSNPVSVGVTLALGNRLPNIGYIVDGKRISPGRPVITSEIIILDSEKIIISDLTLLLNNTLSLNPSRRQIKHDKKSLSPDSWLQSDIDLNSSCRRGIKNLYIAISSLNFTVARAIANQLMNHGYFSNDKIINVRIKKANIPEKILITIHLGN